MGTIFTGLVLLGIVCAIIFKMRRDMKKGRCAGCSCGCERHCGCSDSNFLLSIKEGKGEKFLCGNY